MRNEAQLAGVIAHESGHFLRKHQIRQWRDMRRKTDIFSILAMGAALAGRPAGSTLGDFVQLAQLGTILSLLTYNRTLEAEADAMGVRLLAEAGYRPIAMANLGAVDRRAGRSAPDIAASSAPRQPVRHPPVAEFAHGRPEDLGGGGDGAGPDL